MNTPLLFHLRLGWAHYSLFFASVGTIPLAYLALASVCVAFPRAPYILAMVPFQYLSQ